MTHKTVTILLVEDNLVDREAVLRAFARVRIANPVVCAVDGVDALNALRGHDRERVPRPYLVLLDLNLPRMGGIEFLRTLREDEELRDSVVFVLTTSKRDEDRVASYDFNVAGYILKSEVGTGFMKLISLLEHYWRIVEFP
jgi:CheY-like chemotaxis protein